MAITRPEYILAIDQGTTGTRAVIFNHNARRVTSTAIPMTSIVPHTGWLEQRPLDIWRTAQTAIADALINAGIRGDEIKAIGIANQRETTLIWNRHTGQPIYNAIGWSSTQSQSIADAWHNAGHDELIRAKTGLPVSAYFSVTKIRWILDHVPGAQAQAEAGDLVFGTVDTWLVWQLTDGEVHATDASNAARTMLYNIHTQAWDAELLALFNIPAAMLPQVHTSSDVIAHTNPMQFFGGRVPIASVIGDQNASLVGQLALEPGTIKNTYGAGAFLLMNTGHEPVMSDNQLVTTIAYQVGDRPTYALEGSIFSAGSAVQWLHDRLGLIETQLDAWQAAEASENADEVYVVPAFNGLGAPYWDPQVRGAVFGMTRGTGKNDFIKATLQSIAYQTADILAIMKAESKYDVIKMKADGTVSRNPYLMQFQADVADIQVERSIDEDTTPLGAAFLAGLTVGYWQDLSDLEQYVPQGRQFTASLTAERRATLLNGWRNAVRATQFFSSESE